MKNDSPTYIVIGEISYLVFYLFWVNHNIKSELSEHGTTLEIRVGIRSLGLFPTSGDRMGDIVHSTRCFFNANKKIASA